MKVFERPEDLPHHYPHPVATIGNFDGVHLGHVQLVRDLVRRAAEVGGTSTVLTFQPHPLQVLAPANAPRQIQTLSQKLAVLDCLGVELTVVMPFTRELAQMRAREFAVDILWKKLGLREIYVGPNFGFGHRREGSFNLLKEIGQELGFSVGKIPQVQFRSSRVSSTAVRQALFAGQAGLARRLLGRPFALHGTIAHGAARGGEMRVPTANLETSNDLIPRTGVYVTLLSIDGRRHPAVTNIGVRPTITGGIDAPVTIETHVLDFDGDVYDREVGLEFLVRLRDERKFGGPEALVAQIRKDIGSARRFFRWAREAAPELVSAQLAVC
jgi:riboflavin kinase / FMN adenylyltransferase